MHMDLHTNLFVLNIWYYFNLIFLFNLDHYQMLAACSDLYWTNFVRASVEVTVDSSSSTWNWQSGGRIEFQLDILMF